MDVSRNFVTSLAAVLAAALLAAGCEGIGLGSPVSGTKEVFMGRAAPSPDLPENTKLAVPPQNAPLPVPGQGTNRQWQAQAQSAPGAQAANTAPAAAEPKKEASSGWFGGWF